MCVCVCRRCGYQWRNSEHVRKTRQGKPLQPPHLKPVSPFRRWMVRVGLSLVTVARCLKGTHTHSAHVYSANDILPLSVVT